MKNALGSIIAFIIIAVLLIVDAPIGVLVFVAVGSYVLYAYIISHPKALKTSKKKRVLTKEEESVKNIHDKIDAMTPLTEDEQKKSDEEYERAIWED